MEDKALVINVSHHELLHMQKYKKYCKIWLKHIAANSERKKCLNTIIQLLFYIYKPSYINW